MELSVISFNILCGDGKDGNSISERSERLSKIVLPYDADVIGFQEYKPKWEPLIQRDFGDKYDIFNKYRSESNLESTPILWKKDKFECLKTGYFWLSDTPEVESRGWDELYNCYRICVYAILKEKATGKTFNFMNTHFGFGDKGQISSAKLIYEYSQKISELPTFVVGDFNMTPDSVGYAAMTEKFADVNAKTVNDLSTTYHGFDPETNNNSHIDYCFVDKSIIPVTQKIITETVDGMFPSDHYGIFVKIKI